MADLADDIQKMKDRMKAEGQEKKSVEDAKVPSSPSDSSRSSVSNNNQNENGAKQMMVVPRDPAESLKMLLTEDGVDAVRPGSDAEEHIKKMERQVRSKMKAEREKMLREQQVSIDSCSISVLFFYLRSISFLCVAFWQVVCTHACLCCVCIIWHVDVWNV
jgi:hypothetical protein